LKKAASFCVNAIEEKGGNGKIGEIVKWVRFINANVVGTH
jgi:hypothetical protein